MLRIVLLLLLCIVLARAFWRIVDAMIAAARDPSQDAGARSGTSRSVPMVRDPVCGTFVVPDRAVVLQDGRARLFFCSERCRDTYRARTA